jgi:signal transduction histidine kinase
MRRRAESISAAHLGQRLPLSSRHDELRRLGETLNEMLGRLEEGLGRERAFTADAGHELRTPLTMLRTELELIGRDRPDAERLDAALVSALDEVDRMTRLVEELLTLARAESDELGVQAAELDVAALVGSVVARFRQAHPDRTIDLVAPATLTAHADRDRIAQALGNLLANALQHGGGAVTVSLHAAGGSWELRVADGGPGFPPAFLPHAFERFARAGAAGPHGSGLGLAIVEAIARSHGGGAGAANRPGGGADVWLTIPAGAVTAG